MSMKRLFVQEPDNGMEVLPNRESKRRITFATVVRDAMIGLSHNEFKAKFEPMLRKVVRDEVERGILLYCHSSPTPRLSLNQVESSQSREGELHFDEKLPSTLFTGSRIETEDHKPVKIVIRDANSKRIITSGPLSSAKVEIAVLDGDFGADDWTEKEFSLNLVREREGKRPLLTGELVVTLRDGVGYVGNVCFTDNSSWTRSRKFRLGARTLQRISTEVRIKKARSDSFVVKDHRGESYQKHHPPHLDDEIWRLEKISKDGAFRERLAGQKIFTVKDFLQMYHVDPSSLRNILGGTCKIWETIIKHATACVLDDKLYVYFGDAKSVALIVNSIFKVVGAAFDGNYLSVDKFNVYQAGLVKNLKRHAYKNSNNLVPLDDLSILGPAMLPSSIPANQFSSPSSSPWHVNLAEVHQDQPDQMQLAFTSKPYANAVQDNCQVEVSVAHNCHPMQMFTPTLWNNLTPTVSCFELCGEGNSWARGGSPGAFGLIDRITGDVDSQVDASPWQRNEMLFSPSYDTPGLLASDFGIPISRNEKPKARWCKIRAVIKLGSVRRDVAVKKSKGFPPEFLRAWF